MPLSPGTSLGPYEILGVIGAGGMGEVYRARDTRLGREVAIKLLTGDELPDAAARLRTEARHVSALNHPNICTLHEIGSEQGRPFIVMELVEGETLSARIAPGALPFETVLSIGRQLANALAHAHARGIIHRDLKSANIVITADGRAKILDFGIAAKLPAMDFVEATRSVTALPASNEITGTLAYMAPEVLEGRPADARSDLWALGVVLAEMASGRRPFRGETGFALTSAILRDPPDIPDAVPAALRGVTARLLAKNPAARYQSAAELLAALEALTAGHAPQAAAAGISPSRPPTGAVALAGIAVLSIAVAAALWLRNGTAAGADGIDAIAVLPLANLSSDPAEQYFADGMTEALIADLSAIEDLRVISRTSVMQFRNTTQSLPEIASSLRVQGIVEGAVLHSADRVRITARLIDVRTQRQVWAEEYEEPLSDVITLQRQIARTIGQEIRGRLSAADRARLTRATQVDPAAFQAYLRGRFHWNARSSQDLERAIGLFKDAIARDPDFALAHVGLADTYLVLGDYRQMNPAAAYRLARTAADRALKLDPSLAEAHTSSAWLAFALERDWAAAERAFTRALELNPGYATAHQWHGEYLAARGRFDESMAALQRARELDPLSLITTAIHGWIAYLAGRYDEAIALCESVLELNPDFRPARLYRAWTYIEQNRDDDAIREITWLLDKTDSRTVPLATLGRVQARRGNTAGARRVIDELRGLSYVPSYDIAKVYAALGERDAAFEWLRRADAERNSAVLYVNVDPHFAGLKSDPRFGDLLRDLGLR